MFFRLRDLGFPKVYNFLSSRNIIRIYYMMRKLTGRTKQAEENCTFDVVVIADDTDDEEDADPCLFVADAAMALLCFEKLQGGSAGDLVLDYRWKGT